MKEKREIGERLANIVGRENVFADEPMKDHTTFRVGGPADFFAVPHSQEELQKLIDICTFENEPFFIMGNGSNLLVSDSGYRGTVIQLFKNMNKISCEGNEICAEAGALLSAIAAVALTAGLTGFEFAGGIPGTLGGACTMNAGAYGGEMKNVLASVTVLDENNVKKVIPAEELHMGYRRSVIMDKGYIVLSAAISLKKGEPKRIEETMNELMLRRQTKQPLNMPSAGSTFKRPEGYFAGKLIMDAGLRGMRFGGAQVSEKHCGFIVNSGNATAGDVYGLICLVREKVKADSGVELHPEVRFLGNFNEPGDEK
ncbi:MAG TPA: UDP-N-acetylmuramate dehydrogenase [Lachnospiraceae bacterium]|mgnify:FL=1|nr:UDP-N-acetylmuramate dehydrogenase [Lachnospiraceae bacterium]